MAQIFLPNNDIHIQKYQAFIEEENAKGSNADSEKLLAFYETINVFYHSTNAGVHRINQRERAHKADEVHEKLVESHKNVWAKAAQSVGGSVAVVGAAALTILAVAATMSGVPFAGIQTIVTMGTALLNLATTGTGNFAQAAQSGDQAKQQLLDHEVKNQQTERNDDQSTNQAIDAQKNEALRRKKEQDQQKSSAWSAAAGASR